MMASLTAMGVNGLPFNVIGEDKADFAISFDLSKMLNDIPAVDGMEKIQKQTACLSLLEVLRDTFKIWPPSIPDAGLSAEAILDKFVRADIDRQKGGAGEIDYRSMMMPEGEAFSIEYWSTLRPTHISRPFSVIRELEELSTPAQVEGVGNLAQKRKEFFGFDHEEPLSWLQEARRRSELEEEARRAELKRMVLELYPQFEDEYEPRGKYFARVGAPDWVVVKDKKVLHAMDKCLQPNESLRGIKNAIRNRAKESLRIDGRRIKRDGLHRAYGLYLWETKKEKGYLDLETIDAFRKKVVNIYNDAIPIKQDIPDKDSSIFGDNKELKRLAKRTGECIQKGDVLPIFKK
jgi:hypothetical protein